MDITNDGFVKQIVVFKPTDREVQIDWIEIVWIEIVWIEIVWIEIDSID